MSGVTQLAAVITRAAPPLQEQLRAARAAGADLAELRVDLIGDVEAVEEALRATPRMPVIVTVRSAEEGGAWSGSDAARRGVIRRLVALAPEYVDVELTTWQADAGLRAVVEAQRDVTKLILSQHDFARTPANLAEILDRLAAAGADVGKAVFRAEDATDAWRVLEALRRRAESPAWIVLAMGEAGLVTRVAARKFGALLTFAPLDAEEASAPGQVALSTMRSTYRWDAIGPDTRMYGVVGWPVAHSHGPPIHNAAMGAGGVDGVYVPLPVKPGRAEFFALMAQLTACPQLDVYGLSVTLPHKEHALAWLDVEGQGVSAVARACGAVNTLTRGAEGRWEGDNTDVVGVQAALAAPGWSLERMPVSVLGAGGVARAVVVALRDRCGPITIYARRAARGAALASELGGRAARWEERVHYADGLLVNATPVGMWPAVDETPMPDEAVRAGTRVFDTVYRPEMTRLLRAAQARGGMGISGVEMFLHQAAAQYRRWHGRAAVLATLRGARPPV